MASNDTKLCAILQSCNATLRYLKIKDLIFYCKAGYNRTEMCRKLTKIFGWEVNENSLRKAQEEAEKHKK